MNILKVHSKRSPSKFMGAFLPPSSNSYFALYTLAKGVSKSEFVRGLFEEWINRQSVTDDVDKLISEIVTKIKSEFADEKLINSALTLNEYKTRVCIELKTRGLEIEFINKILADVT
jgi:hypothetical protein